jgi:hypothetical protein
MVITMFRRLLKWMGKGKFPGSRKIGRIAIDHRQGWERSKGLLKYDYQGHEHPHYNPASITVTIEFKTPHYQVINVNNNTLTLHM